MDDNIDNVQLLPGGQMSLLPESVTDDMLEERSYKQGIYSGQQLKAVDPDKYMQVCALLADGSLSQRRISRLTHVCRNLISAINRQSVDIEPLKKQIASRARNVAALTFERIEEILRDPTAKVTLRDLGIIGGIAVDKSQVLSGGPTSIVRREREELGDDEYGELLEQLAGVVEDAEFEMLPPSPSKDGFCGAETSTKREPGDGDQEGDSDA